MQRISSAWVRLGFASVVGAGVWLAGTTASFAGEKLHFTEATDLPELRQAEQATLPQDEINFFGNDPTKKIAPVMMVPPSLSPVRRNNNNSSGNSDWGSDPLSRDIHSSMWSDGPTNNTGYFQSSSNQYSRSVMDHETAMRRELDGINPRLRPTQGSLDPVNMRGSSSRADGLLGSQETKDTFNHRDGNVSLSRYSSDTLRPDSIFSSQAKSSAADDQSYMSRASRSVTAPISPFTSSLSSSLSPVSPSGSIFNSGSYANASKGESPLVTSGGSDFVRHSMDAYHESGSAGMPKNSIDLTGPAGPLPGMNSLENNSRHWGAADSTAKLPQHKSIADETPIPNQQGRPTPELRFPRKPGQIFN